MSVIQTLSAGCYRLAENVRLTHTEQGGVVAICDYPLRVVPLSPTQARLLSLCTEERSCTELATLLSLPLKRVDALCDALRWKSLLEAGPAVQPTTWPPLSIIIPSYNRAAELERCLRALFLLEYPQSLLEILVVDDASTDTTSTVLLSLLLEAETHNIQLRSVRHEQRQGVAISRNTGAGAALHELIAYIDSDCVASPTWLSELVPLFQDTRVVAVGGMIRGYECKSILGRYEDTCSSLFMGTRPQQVRLEGPLTYLPTANFLVRRAIWQQLGGFAPLTQGEDVDFCRRILLNGSHIRYVPQGVVYHDYRTTLKAFLKIRAAYATAEAALLQRHPTERRVSLSFHPNKLPSRELCLVVYGEWLLLFLPKKRESRVRFIAPVGVRFITPKHERSNVRSPFIVTLIISLFLAVLTLFSTCKRYQKVRQQHIPIPFITVFKATLRGNLAYTYHLCRHLTRYYTLPLLLIGLLFFPLVILIAIMLCIVTSVDYWRLKPSMNWAGYATCAVLSDCAYEVGVVQGCVKHRTWKPLVPIVKRHI